MQESNIPYNTLDPECIYHNNTHINIFSVKPRYNEMNTTNTINLEIENIGWNDNTHYPNQNFNIALPYRIPFTIFPACKFNSRTIKPTTISEFSEPGETIIDNSTYRFQQYEGTTTKPISDHIDKVLMSTKYIEQITNLLPVKRFFSVIKILNEGSSVNIGKIKIDAFTTSSPQREMIAISYIVTVKLLFATEILELGLASAKYPSVDLHDANIQQDANWSGTCELAKHFRDVKSYEYAIPMTAIFELNLGVGIDDQFSDLTLSRVIYHNDLNFHHNDNNYSPITSTNNTNSYRVIPQYLVFTGFESEFILPDFTSARHEYIIPGYIIKNYKYDTLLHGSLPNNILDYFYNDDQHHKIIIDRTIATNNQFLDTLIKSNQTFYIPYNEKEIVNSISVIEFNGKIILGVSFYTGTLSQSTSWLSNNYANTIIYVLNKTTLAVEQTIELNWNTVRFGCANVKIINDNTTFKVITRSINDSMTHILVYDSNYINISTHNFGCRLTYDYDIGETEITTFNQTGIISNKILLFNNDMFINNKLIQLSYIGQRTVDNRFYFACFYSKIITTFDESDLLKTKYNVVYKSYFYNLKENLGVPYDFILFPSDTYNITFRNYRKIICEFINNVPNIIQVHDAISKIDVGTTCTIVPYGNLQLAIRMSAAAENSISDVTIGNVIKYGYTANQDLAITDTNIINSWANNCPLDATINTRVIGKNTNFLIFSEKININRFVKPVIDFESIIDLNNTTVGLQPYDTTKAYITIDRTKLNPILANTGFRAKLVKVSDSLDATGSYGRVDDSSYWFSLENTPTYELAYQVYLNNYGSVETYIYKTHSLTSLRNIYLYPNSFLLNIRDRGLRRNGEQLSTIEKYQATIKDNTDYTFTKNVSGECRTNKGSVDIFTKTGISPPTKALNSEAIDPALNYGIKMWFIAVEKNAGSNYNKYLNPKAYYAALHPNDPGKYIIGRQPGNRYVGAYGEYIPTVVTYLPNLRDVSDLTESIPSDSSVFRCQPGNSGTTNNPFPSSVEYTFNDLPAGEWMILLILQVVNGPAALYCLTDPNNKFDIVE